MSELVQIYDGNSVVLAVHVAEQLQAVGLIKRYQIVGKQVLAEISASYDLVRVRWYALGFSHARLRSIAEPTNPPDSPLPVFASGQASLPAQDT